MGKSVSITRKDGFLQRMESTQVQMIFNQMVLIVSLLMGLHAMLIMVLNVIKPLDKAAQL